MNHWPFVIAAYGVTIAGSAAIALASWRAMVRGEAAAEQLKR